MNRRRRPPRPLGEDARVPADVRGTAARDGDATSAPDRTVPVAILVAGLPPDRIGGTERQAAQVARLLSEQGPVVVFTRSKSMPPELAAAARCLVIRRCGVSWSGVRFAADIMQSLLLLRRHRRRIAVTLAYQSVIDGLIAVLARVLFGIPAIVAVRSEVEYDLRGGQSRWLAPFVFRHADRLVLQSPRLADGLFEAFERAGRKSDADRLRHKVCIIPNGVTEATTAPSPRDLVVFIGRLVPVKGTRMLLSAMRQCPDQRLVVIGDGPDRAALERVARDQANVTFVGERAMDEVNAYLTRARVLVHPSSKEGQPNVILEAMAHAVPVIACRVGGVPDLVSDGRTGILVDPGDTTALARAIRLLSSDDGRWAEMSVQARQAVARHRWPTVVATIQAELAAVSATPTSHSRRFAEARVV